jgi:hypothetical protein
MNPMLNLMLRGLCLAVYAIALARLAGLLPPGSFERTPWIAAALLAAHAAEVGLFFRHLRLYPGPLALSVVLTLLFGLLHWKPLADRQAAADPTARRP